MRSRLALCGAACALAVLAAAPGGAADGGAAARANDVAAAAAPASDVAAAPAPVKTPTTPAKAPPAQASAKRAAPAPKVAQVTLGVRHRVFADFGQRVSARMQERFAIGDTDYSGQIVQFMPHFDYDIKKRRAVNRSNALDNPAFQVVVREKGVPKDTSWVFVNSPPHFSRRSMLAFQVLRVDFDGRPPLVADSSAAGASAR